MKQIRRWLPVLVVCVITPLVLVGSIVQRYSTFSPIDEAAHFDYVQRLPGSGIPIMGDTMLQSSLDIIACRGSDLPGLVLPKCGTDEVKPEAFPGQGLQYEAQQPPLYYLTAAPLAWVGSEVLGLGELGATRSVGVLWLIAGMLLLYFTGELLKIRRWVLLSCMFAVVSAPVVTYHTAIVSNDSTVLFYAALMAFIAALTHVRQKPYIWFALISALLAGFTKSTIVTAIFATGGFLVLATLPMPISELKRFWTSAKWQIYGKTGLAMIIGGLVSGLVWNYISRARATIPGDVFPTFDVLRGQPVGVISIMREALIVFGPLTDSYTPFGVWNGDVMQLLSALTRLVLFGAGMAGAFVAGRSWWRMAGPIALTAQYFGAVALGIGIWRSYNMTPGLVGRYGLVMVPALILVLAAGVQRPLGRWVLSAGSIGVGLLFTWITFQTPLA